ncbi:MAG: GntR family transcriptional regulator [Nitrospirae bacterium]|nr:GntR family transcriptional regulator [Nitrospirota bacterium]
MQLTRIILDEIHSGRWELGSQILTEEDLCKKYNVSKITVRQAINNLVSDGYLIKIQGKGTFVNSALPAVGLSMKTRLTEDMFGKEVQVRKTVLSRGWREPSPDAKGFLNADGDVYCIMCIRAVGGEPAYLEESFVPAGMLTDEDSLDIENSSLYAALQERSSKRIFKVVQTIEVAKVSGDAARHLKINEDESVLAVHRLLLSSDATPVAYTLFQGRSDKYKFQIELERIR